MSQQEAQQTPLIYPVSETNPPSHHQSDGSFGAVFIVLAVIVVISAIACFLGRLCSKRHSKFKPSKQGHASRPPKEKDMKHNRNAFQTKDGDIEFGFDKRFSSAKVAANGEPTMGRPNSSREPNMGRPNSFREPSMGRPDSFREPSMGRPNSFRKGEFRDDQVRFAANQDHEMNFKSGNGPVHY
ncbi:hypothetical protein L6452_12943 [Arctium lappa]|uniref:Uncharacterized protein n=1 Tax=Arctium lappa TaxID=4217 RepID=A0ACB9CGX7_ARCLA|nr:hypothetical protein L6452_12943 [Arctium lappa]